MRLVIDLQPLFAPSTAQRGIGFYSEQLARALCAQARGHEVHLLVTSAADAQAVVAVREAFRDLVSHERVHLLEPVLARDVRPDDFAGAARVNEALRESLLASVCPDAVLVTSLFELPTDCPTSVHRWVGQTPTAVVLYDLMPLEDPGALLADPAARRRYERGLEDLRRASVLLCISEHTAERARALLDPCPATATVLGAAIPTPSSKHGAPPAGLSGRSVVLYVGGDHPRKNMDGLVKAWARVPRRVRGGRALVIACHLGRETAKRLAEVGRVEGLDAGELLLTGYVSREDLAWLYDHAELFVFPSFSEGLGLPALEAMQRGCAVLVADATSLRELVAAPLARFDPASPEDMAAAISRALDDPALLAELQRDALEQVERFTWERTAARAWDALEAMVEQAPAPATPLSRPRSLAVVSPWPPVRSGVADYAERTTAALAAHYDVTMVGEARQRDGMRRITRSEFTQTWHEYDRVLYHFGNSPHHTDDMALLPRAPGVVLLHDSTLAETLRFADEPLGHPDGVEALLRESGGRPHGGGLTNQRGLRSVLSGAVGVQVHSPHAAAEVARAGFSQAPVAVVPHPVLEVGAAADRTRPGSVDGLVVGHFGFVHAFKQPELLLDAAGLAAHRLGRIVEVAFVGAVSDPSYQGVLQRAADRAGVPVRFEGYVDADELGRWTATVDCAVQLRSVSHGESSGSVTRLLAAGRPVVVSDIGSFRDLPRDVVRHHPVDGGSEELATALVECLTPATGSELGRRAAGYAAEELSLTAWAAQTRDALEMAYAGHPGVVGGAALRQACAGTSDRVREAMVASVAGSAARRAGAVQVWGSDVSMLAVTPFLTGIQRVTLSLHRELAPLLERRRTGLVAVDPVPPPARRHAHAAICQDLVLGGVEVLAADCAWLLGIDLDFGLPSVEQSLLEARARGMRLLVNVYDLLIVTNPEWFVPGAAETVFLPWLRTVVRIADVLTVNSRATGDVLKAWVANNMPERLRDLRIEVLRLGVDLPRVQQELPVTNTVPHFVIVGTIEPRKGHDDVLDAFDQLWRDGVDVRLTVVGRQGWSVEDLSRRLRGHRELGRRLQWLSSADDDVLDDVLAHSDGMLVASRGEGFGLPVLEAAARRLPLVVCDIPVLREVAGDGAIYFSGGGQELAATLRAFTDAWRSGADLTPASVDIRTWADVASDLVLLLGDEGGNAAPVR